MADYVNKNFVRPMKIDKTQFVREEEVYSHLLSQRRASIV
jgi:hypothetical protein